MDIERRIVADNIVYVALVSLMRGQFSAAVLFGMPNAVGRCYTVAKCRHYRRKMKER